MLIVESKTLEYPEDLKFEIKTSPMTFPSGNKSKSRIAVMHDGDFKDKKDGIEIYDYDVGSDYSPHSHYKVMDIASEILASNFNTNDIDVYDYLDKEYAQAKREIILNDYSENIKSQRKLNDTCSIKVNIESSLDGKKPMRITISIIRLACKNGMTTADNFITSVRKHTSAFSLSDFKDKVIYYASNGAKSFERDIETFKDLVKRNITDEEVIKFLKQGMCYTKKPSKDTSEHFNKKMFENMLREYRLNQRHLGSTAWSLYNAMTHYSTHAEDSKWLDDKQELKTNTLRVIDLREREVYKALTSDAWQSLLNSASFVEYR
tara:strand:- start:594 stop:1553 length:960 start_codon:yes stop_codon:yes gene_type:complete